MQKNQLETKEQILEALDKMAKGHPLDREFGTCSNITFIIPDEARFHYDYELSREEIEKFEYFSGDYMYAVGHPDIVGGREAYLYEFSSEIRGALWRGKYGQRRKAFAKHWAKCLRKRKDG